MENFSRKAFHVKIAAYRDFSEDEWSRMGSPDDKSDMMAIE